MRQQMRSIGPPHQALFVEEVAGHYLWQQGEQPCQQPEKAEMIAELLMVGCTCLPGHGINGDPLTARVPVPVLEAVYKLSVAVVVV